MIIDDYLKDTNTEMVDSFVYESGVVALLARNLDSTVGFLLFPTKTKHIYLIFKEPSWGHRQLIGVEEWSLCGKTYNGVIIVEKQNVVEGWLGYEQDWRIEEVPAQEMYRRLTIGTTISMDIAVFKVFQ